MTSAQGEQPRVLISIVNWNGYEDTLRCIESLRGQAYDGPSHIIVVDNASRNDSVKRIRAAVADITLIESPRNDGFAAGHLQSVSYAREHGYPLLWILNPDLTLHPEALTALVNAWQEKGDGVFGSISLTSPDDDTIVFAGGHELKNGAEASGYNAFKGKSLSATPEALRTRPVTAIEGFSMMVPLSVIDKHGFMDTRYFMYGEETIWCYDFRKKGVTVYVVPASVVYHRGYGSVTDERPTDNPMVVYYRTRNYLLWMRKHYGWSRWRVMRKKGGVWSLVRFYMAWLIKGRTWREKNWNNWYENLAVVHAFLGLRIHPIRANKFISYMV